MDLFAGTGALGIEALSRGAHGGVFVDQRKSAIESIRRNIGACGLVERTRVLCCDILKNLNCLRSSPCPFTIVFMDPPYGRDFIARSLDNLWRSGSLAPDARIVVEHMAQEALPDALSHFVLDDQRRYGNTLVSFLNCVI